MSFANALFVTRQVNDWLANTQHPALLHFFDRACNLINEHRQVLSIVTSEIGKGPFNLLVDKDPQFTAHVDTVSPISIDATTVHIGSLTLRTQYAQIWNASPDWKMLHANLDIILRQVSRLSTIKSPVSNLQFSNPLPSSLAIADLPSSIIAAKKLAGLGPGLTPSGDDYMMGAMHAVWILHPHEVAQRLTRELAEFTAPLTTSLSAAWLRAAGNGEAGIAWHALFEALVSGQETAVQQRISNILSVGATSGADAFAGFIDTFIAYMETEKKHVLP